MNEGLLFSENFDKASCRRYLKDKQFVYESETDTLDSAELRRMIKFVNIVEKASVFTKLPIIFKFETLKLNDKISYILFEYICYYLIKFRKCKCCVMINFEDSILSYYAKSSPLFLLTYQKVIGAQANFEKISEDYIKAFENQLESQHIRKIIKKEELGTDANSKFSTNVSLTLGFLDMEEAQVDSICEVISELVDNAGEHADADCLVDIDITPEHIKRDSEDSYYGVNIVVLNFSKELLGNHIEDVLKSDTSPNEWYMKLKEARSFHKNFWNDIYTERDFYIMSAFQNKISTRSEDYYTGGTGLTKLIAALEYQSDAYKCFVWTGNRTLAFWHPLLQLDDSDWVGFNNEKNFVQSPPNTDIFQKSKIYFPGTAYNLSFVLKKEN